MGLCPNTYNRSSSLTWSSLDTPLFTRPEVYFASLLGVFLNLVKLPAMLAILTRKASAECVCPLTHVYAGVQTGSVCGVILGLSLWYVHQGDGGWAWLFWRSGAPLALGVLL